jgi:hypothetical protein
MRIFGFLRCMAIGKHDWHTSQSMTGHQTCWRCRIRRKAKPADGPKPSR